MMNVRAMILVFAGVAAVALGSAYAWKARNSHPTDAPVAAPAAAQIGGPFRLTDQNGRAVDEQVLKGKWSAVFFGYTYCPDVCPGTLQALNAAAAKLGPKAKDLQIVFISVDSQRDNPAQMKAYLEAQNLPANTLGLTGGPGEIAAAAKAYRTYYALEGQGDDLTVSHMNTIYLMNPQGRFVKPLNYDIPPDQMARLIGEAMS